VRDGPQHARRLQACLIVAIGYFTIVSIGVLLRLEALQRSVEPDGYQGHALWEVLKLHGLAAGLLACVFVWVRRRGGVWPGWNKLSLAAMPFVLLASVDRLATVAYRPILSGPSIFEPHKTRGWAHRAGATARYSDQLIRINAKGLRGPEVPYHKPNTTAQSHFPLRA